METGTMMRTLITCFIIFFVCLNATAQRASKGQLIFDRKSKGYVKVLAPVTSTATTNTRKYIPSHTFVWALSTPAVPGHWERARAAELKERRKQTAPFLYPVKNLAFRKYTGPIAAELANIREQSNLLAAEEQLNVVLPQASGGINTHYINKFRLGTLMLNGESPNIVVADSLIIPVAAPLMASIIGNYRTNTPFLKIIANTVVYESPALISLIGIQNGDIVCSAKEVYLRSVYEGLEASELTPAPPLFTVAQGNQANIFQQFPGATELSLLNRLFTRLMAQSAAKLAGEQDDWTADKLISQFQFYRFNRVTAADLTTDPPTQKSFTDLTSEFDNKYQDHIIKRLRRLNNLNIIANGDINRLPFQPIQYYAIPTRATVQPLINGNHIGTVEFTGSGEANLKVIIETELGYDSVNFNKAAAEIISKGLTLQPKLHESVIRINEQPLKINGSTIGKIIAVSNRLLRLELNITEGTTSIARWFPRDGHATFNLDMNIENQSNPISETIELVLDSTILEQLDYQQPLKSFQVTEKNSLTGEIKIASNLSPARTSEGALNYVEVLVELQFPDKNVLYGPFRLSAYNTLASEKIFPFIRHNDTFKTMVYGKAVYDNGEITIKSFESNSLIIALDDSSLNVAP